MRWIFYLILLFPIYAPGQDLKAIPITGMPLKADRFVGVDDYKNLYFINGNVFHKKNQEKDLQFSDLQLGAISSVDLINPLRITLFYAQFNMAVILDNALNEITRVDFNKLENFKNVTQARTASDRRLWIFNNDLRQIELFDYQNLNVGASSPPLVDAVLKMASNFNTCWVYTGKKLQAFNNYGSLVYTLNVDDLDKIWLFQDTIFALKKGQLLLLDKERQSFKNTGLDENGLHQLFWAQEILYIYTGNCLKTYNLSIPKD